MSGTDNSDPFDSLFADALKAVENVEKIKPTVESTDSNVEILEEFEVDFEDFEIEIESEIDSSGTDNEAFILLQEEMAALEKQYEQLRRKMTLVKDENERYEQRLASAHTHMQSMVEQRNQFRNSGQAKQDALDNAEQRVRRLESTFERQQQQLERNSAVRRKEQEETKKYGASSTLQKLLPAFDSLDLAIQNLEKDPESLKEGLRLVHQQLTNALSSAGVEQIDSEPGTKFNPSHHEALLSVASDTIDSGHIVQKFCGAYQLHDRLLRAAQVSVAAKK
jgi:molecular chaperone GrpE